MSSPTVSTLQSLVLISPSRQTLSPPISLPRPPRCLTPYPIRIQFSPKSSSPLSTPSISPDDLLPINLNHDPFDDSRPILTHPPCPTFPRRGIPIELQMSSLSPTDSSFPNIPPTLLSPSINRAWTKAAMSGKIPLSPGAKKYMQQKGPRKSRPNPIQVPLRLSAPVFRSAATAQGRGRVRIQTPISRSPLEGGSVPLPKTPRVEVETPGRTAMPLTSRRVGSVKEAATVGEIEVELDGIDAISVDEVPVLNDQPSPGWADMLSASI